MFSSYFYCYYFFFFLKKNLHNCFVYFSLALENIVDFARFLLLFLLKDFDLF